MKGPVLALIWHPVQGLVGDGLGRAGRGTVVGGIYSPPGGLKPSCLLL